MTSTCAVRPVLFGWKQRFWTPLHSLHYQLIKSNWYGYNICCGLTCIQCAPVTNTLRQCWRYRSTCLLNAWCGWFISAVCVWADWLLLMSRWWTLSALLPLFIYLNEQNKQVICFYVTDSVLYHACVYHMKTRGACLEQRWYKFL